MKRKEARKKQVNISFKGGWGEPALNGMDCVCFIVIPSLQSNDVAKCSCLVFFLELLHQGVITSSREVCAIFKCVCILVHAVISKIYTMAYPSSTQKQEMP